MTISDSDDYYVLILVEQNNLQIPFQGAVLPFEPCLLVQDDD